MGKSPGKWIKTILFGKKHSKSTLSKNGTPDKKTAVKTPVEDLSGDYLVISDPCQSTERGVENSELDKGTSGSHCDPIALSPANQVVVSLSNNASLPHSDAEMGRQEQAAAKAQAAFRGYLARRAFRALKGIIRLQALIRGHLVRRQAVATLRCMQAIVKFQASIQGRKVKSGSNLLFGSEKLAKNIFVRKLLVKLPTAMPLSFQYDLAESNSAWNWLERWSASHFWEPPTHTKKILKAKPQKKQGGTQVVGSEYGKSRRTIRSVPAMTNGENCALASSEMDKPKHHTRKAASNQTEMVEEQPHNELERVKHNLRKISESAVAAASEKSEIDTKKPQPQLHQSVEMETNSASPDVSKREVVISSENLGNSDVVIDKGESLEAPSNTTIDEPVDVTHDNDPVVDTHSLDNGVKMESPLTMDDELSCKEEKSRKDNHKIQKKRSVPSKQECSENSSQNSPCLPSYMAATESAKAKLRAQGSPKVGEDGDENGYTRRHSLPASANGKLSSLSPGIQKHVRGNGKGGSKTNRSLTSSRDDKVVVQPGWRR